MFENKKSAVIYFGYSKCAYCRSAVSVLIDAAMLSRLEEIYYLDTEKLNDNELNKLYDVLGDEIVMDDSNNKSLDVPLVVFLSNGNIVGYHKGTIFSQYSAYQKLDESQENGLKEIYRFGIVFIQHDNTLTPVFNVRGINNLQEEYDNNGKPVKQFTETDIYDENGNRIFIDVNENTNLLIQGNIG
jgi:predicted bacteriocin transport accessory protein